MKKQEKKELLLLMHEIMLNMNHEDAYMRWICVGVPDCPDKDDFDYIASDADSFNETVQHFMNIFNDYKKDGLSYGSKYACKLVGKFKL